MASITQTGPNSWRVQIRRRGIQPITKTFRTRRLAERWAARAEADIDEGKPVTAVDGLTVRAAIDAFRELRENGQRPIARGSTEFYMLAHLEGGLGESLLESVTPAKLVRWARQRMDAGAGPATVGMEVSKLGTVCRQAGVWLHRSLPDVVTPARAVLEYNGLVGPSNHRDRRPSPHELQQLLEAADPTMADLITLAILTAMRRGELARILWEDLDVERRLILIRDRKHPRKTVGNHQWCPLIGDALQVIQRQPKVGSRIFPVEPEWISDTFKGLCDRLGIVDLHFHDMRHEGTSRLFEAGYQIEQVRMVTGHKKLDHLMRYTNLRPEHLSVPESGPAWLRRASGPDTQPRPDSQHTGGLDPDTSPEEIDPR